MPRVLVTTDGPKQSRRIVVDEAVNPAHLDSDHSAGQLIERLAWGIDDAERAEKALSDAYSSTPYQEVGA